MEMNVNALAAAKTAELVAMNNKTAAEELKRRIDKRAADGKHPVTSTIEAYNTLAKSLGLGEMPVPEFKSKSFLATASIEDVVAKLKQRSDLPQLMAKLAAELH